MRGCGKIYVFKKHSVAAIVISKSGKIFNEMSMEFDCGMDACAERNAFFKRMSEENEVKLVVAMFDDKILSPCGICREVMVQMNRKNLEKTWVIISGKEKIRLKELLQHIWQEVFD